MASLQTALLCPIFVKISPVQFTLHQMQGSINFYFTANYVMACEPEVGHAGGQAADRVVSRQRGSRSIQVTVVEGLCVLST